MLTKAFVTRAILMTALFLAGCGLKPGATLIAFNAGGTGLPTPATATVDKPGIYALFPGDGINPLTKLELKHGDVVGFRRAGDGQIVGFAGEKEFNLNGILASEYVWKYLGTDKP